MEKDKKELPEKSLMETSAAPVSTLQDNGRYDDRLPIRRRTPGVPMVHVAERKRSEPIFDTHYFLTAMTHIFVALAAVGFALYIVIQLVGDITPTVTTTPAVMSTESEYENATAYIMRREMVLTSPSAGGAMRYLLDDGEMVSLGEDAAYIYPAEDAETIARADEIEGEIALLETALKKSQSSENILGVSASLSGTYAELMQNISVNDYGGAANLSDELRRLLIRYDAYRGSDNDIKSTITAMNSELTRLLSLCGNTLADVTAPCSGYYFRYCDGYESIFGEDLIDHFSSDAFYAALGAAPSIPQGAVGKIVEGSQWYIAATVTEHSSGDYNIGDEYNIIFENNSGTSVPMTLESITDDDVTGGLILLFSTRTMPVGFNYQRLQQVRVEQKLLSGYRIPMSAVRAYRGMTGVYTLSGGLVSFRRIDILYQNDDYCIAAEYSTVSGDRTPTYRVLGFNSNGYIGEYRSLHLFAESRGWERRIYDNGGEPIKYGSKEDYYYYLDELEDIILTGKNLYDGKKLS